MEVDIINNTGYHQTLNAYSTINRLRNIEQYRKAECFNRLKSLKTTKISRIDKLGPMHDGPHHSVAKVSCRLRLFNNVNLGVVKTSPALLRLHRDR